MKVITRIPKSTLRWVKSLVEVENPNTGKVCTFIAVWDTGSTTTCITKDAAELLELETTGDEVTLKTYYYTATQPFYKANLYLTKDVVAKIPLAQGNKRWHGDSDILIGMDIIGQCEFHTKYTKKGLLVRFRPSDKANFNQSDEKSDIGLEKCLNTYTFATQT